VITRAKLKRMGDEVLTVPADERWRQLVALLPKCCRCAERIATHVSSERFECDVLVCFCCRKTPYDFGGSVDVRPLPYAAHVAAYEKESSQ